MDLLKNDNWRIRVAGTYACRLLEPGQPLFNGLAPGLGDRHWLVRLTTADVLAQLQGTAALPILEHLARNDSQALVRQLATSYLLDMHK